MEICGGTATDTTVNSGGSMVIYDGTATDTIVKTGGYMEIRGGTVTDTTVNSGGTMEIDGTTTNMTVKAGGTINGFSFEKDTFYKSEIHIVNHHVNGSAFLYTGQSATGTIVNAGGYMCIAGGTTSDTTVNSGGSMIIRNGTVANATTVKADGSMSIEGGTATNTTVNSGGSMIVKYGTVVNTTIKAGGTINGFFIEKDTIYESEIHIVNHHMNSSAFLGSGLNATGTIVNAGGELSIQYNGTAADTTINSGGSMYVERGTATDTTINSGGYMYVAGPSQWYVTGGTAIGTIVNSGGNITVGESGTITNTTVNSGGMINGFAVRENSYYESSFNISNTYVNATAVLYYDQTAINTTVNSGGNMTVKEYGTATNTTVNSGGNITIEEYGTIANTTVNSGGMINGFAIGENSYYKSSINTFSNTYVNATATLYRSQTAINTIVNSGGNISLGKYSTMTATTVNSGGEITATYFGSVSSTTLLAGALMTIGWMSNATSTTINSGGIMTIGGKGHACLTTVLAGGKIMVGAGYYKDSIPISSTTINAGGIINGFILRKDSYYESGFHLYDTYVKDSAVLYDGQMATATTVNSGGTMVVSSGGSAIGLQIEKGATVILEEDTSLEFHLSNRLPDNTIVINDWDLITDMGASCSITLNKEQWNGIYQLVGNAESFNKEMTITVDGIGIIGTFENSNGKITNNNYTYTLGKNENDILTLTVTGGLNAPDPGVDPTPNPDPGVDPTPNPDPGIDPTPNPDPGVDPTPKPEPGQPAAPDGTTVTVKKYNATFSWNKYPAAKGVKVKYQIMVDGAADGKLSSGTKYTFKNAAVGSHSFSVRAVLSEKGKEDVYTAWSGNLTQYVADVTAPKTGKLSLVQTGEDSVKLNWTAANDNVGVSRYIVTCGNETRELGGGIFETEFHGKAGKVAASIITYDEAGNAGKTVKKTLSMKDRTAPTQVSGLRSEGVDNKSGGVLAWDPSSDNVGVTQYLIAIEGGKTCKSKTNSVRIKKMAAGTYRYTVIALDKAKNQSIVSTAGEFTVADVICPKIKKLSSKVTDQSAEVTWNATDEVGIVRSELWCDDQRFDTTGLSSWNLSGLESGRHTLRLNVWDAAGNMSVKMANCNVKALAQTASSAGMLAAI